MFGFHGQRQQADSVDKEFIGQHWSVLVEEDFMEGHGGYFGDDDSAEGVGNWGVDAVELHFEGVGLAIGEMDGGIFFEVCEVEDFIDNFLFDDFFFFEANDFFVVHEGQQSIRKSIYL